MILCIVVCVIFVINLTSAQNLLCTDTFCSDYKDKITCPKIPPNCEIQNVTNNGLELPFTGPCNCCPYCLDNLVEGATCAIGGPTSSVPTNICGDGLACKEKKCVKIETVCTQAQKQYDIDRENGDLGHLQVRPDCDRNGAFVTYVCVPGEICYCINENGQRIFGEIEFTSVANILLKCKCSRAYDSFANTIGRELLPNMHLHCSSDGSYDSIQCIGDGCLCVDKDDGKPTYPNVALVNITQISASKLPCFDNKTHIEYEYYRDCEYEYEKMYAEIESFKEEGYEVFGDMFPSCQLDGKYNSVQYNKTHKYCVDPNGEIIQDYIVDKNDELASSMDCKCARSSSIITTNEKPSCLPNGNYNSIQCRRGLCRCVDTNGNQIKPKEVDISQQETLKCIQPEKL